MELINNPEFIEAIHRMYDNGMTNFNTVDSYMPYDTITRAQAAKILDIFSTTMSLSLTP